MAASLKSVVWPSYRCHEAARPHWSNREERLYPHSAWWTARLVSEPENGCLPACPTPSRNQTAFGQAHPQDAQGLTEQALGVHASIGRPLKISIRMQKNISQYANLRPQPSALTNCATFPQGTWIHLQLIASRSQKHQKQRSDVGSFVPFITRMFIRVNDSHPPMSSSGILISTTSPSAAEPPFIDSQFL